MARWSSGLRLRPLTPATWVRIPYGSPKNQQLQFIYVIKRVKLFYIVGVDCDEGPPVPIPNTEVKLICAEDTWLVTARENR